MFAEVVVDMAHAKPIESRLCQQRRADTCCRFTLLVFFASSGHVPGISPSSISARVVERERLVEHELHRRAFVEQRMRLGGRDAGEKTVEIIE
jgi:hypothetical protein